MKTNGDKIKRVKRSDVLVKDLKIDENFNQYFGKSFSLLSNLKFCCIIIF